VLAAPAKRMRDDRYPNPKKKKGNREIDRLTVFKPFEIGYLVLADVVKEKIHLFPALWK
jgi:hypothetical protein